MSIDPEGNRFNQVSNIEVYSFMKGRFGAEIKFEKLTDELRSDGYCEEDVDVDQEGEPAVVLWP